MEKIETTETIIIGKKQDFETKSQPLIRSL